MTLAEKSLRNATSATAIFILKKALQKHLFADSADDRLKLMDKVVYLDFVVEIIRRSDDQKELQVLPPVESSSALRLDARWRRLGAVMSRASTSLTP